jgi:hypothetical protein
MFRIERLTSAITANKIRLAVVLALAAASFLYLAVMVGTKTGQVGEPVRSTASTTYDMIDEPGLGPASWDCATVPIAIKCGGTQSASNAGMIEGVWHGLVTSQRASNLGNQITLVPNN